MPRSWRNPFSVPHRCVLSQLSFLLPATSNPAIAVNGIDPKATQLSQPWHQSLQLFEAMAAAADVAVAHNACFDRRWFGCGQLPCIDMPWVCSMEDLAWPKALGLKARPSLRDLALAFSIPVWAAHRALTDCIYIAQVFERCDDLEALLLEALEPRQLYQAQVSYAQRQLAKDAGFRWNEPIKGLGPVASAKGNCKPWNYHLKQNRWRVNHWLLCWSHGSQHFAKPATLHLAKGPHMGKAHP